MSQDDRYSATNPEALTRSRRGAVCAMFIASVAGFGALGLFCGRLIASPVDPKEPATLALGFAIAGFLVACFARPAVEFTLDWMYQMLRVQHKLVGLASRAEGRNPVASSPKVASHDPL